MKKVIFAFMATVISYGVIAQKLETDKVPTAVASAFKTKFPTVTKSSWERESNTEFEVNFKINDEEVSASFDDTGKWLETETEIKASSLSAAIHATLKNEFAGFKITEASKIENADGATSYEAEIKKGKESFDVLLLIDGKVLKKTRIEKSKEEKD